MSLHNLNAHFHNGVGSGGRNSSLPMQTVPKSKKTPKFFRNTMDALESIGMYQMSQNMDFIDYYDMTEGRLVYKDFMSEEDFRSLREIGTVMKDVQLPTYIKHYDILGMIVNQLVGELPSMTDAINMKSDDDYAKNDYIRQKEVMVEQYVKESFANQLNKLLALKGINPIKEDFESEEEQQQYLQYLEAEKAKIITPRQIEDHMNKSWKVRAVEWAEKRYEQDVAYFNMEDMEEQEMKDYLLTGRFFTHYHIGYDYYKPERWHPVQTFFSQHLNIENPQDGEFVGRIDFLTSSQIIERYGDKLGEKDILSISKVHDNYRDASGGGTSSAQSPYAKPVQGVVVPDEDYFDREIYLQYESAFGQPLGESTVLDENGEEQVIPTWLSSYNDSNIYMSNGIAQKIRKDIEVGSNVFRVTEGYWKGFNLHYAIRYDTDEGFTVEDIVKEDLMNEFIQENNISIKRTMSLEEFRKSDDTNIIAPTYFPTVYQGKKISGTAKEEDIHFDMREMDFQIRGNSNFYDVKLPVVGIIGNSLAQKIRPYQLNYNIALNQITHLMEKELGSFFLVDIGLLPSEFKESGNTSEILSELRETIRDIGIFPVDMKKQNTQQPGNTANTFIQQRISFTEEINQRIQTAEYNKRLAFEQIGITEQRKGTPSEYQTNEGIKVGQEASYAQTKGIYTKFNNARKKKIELHLSVAQYCVENDKDITTFYTNSDNQNIFHKFSDDKFHLRSLNVIPTSNSKDKKQLESLKQRMLVDNTSGYDVLALGKIASTDNFSSLIEFGQKERARQQQLENEKRQFEASQLDKQITIQKETRLEDMAFKKQMNDDNNKTKILTERIESLGRLTNADGNDEDIKAVGMATDAALKEMGIENQNQVENRKLDLQENKNAQEMQLKMAQLNKELKALELKNKELETKRYVATINKN